MFPVGDHTNKRKNQQMLAKAIDVAIKEDKLYQTQGVVVALSGPQPNDAVVEYVRRPHLYKECHLIENDPKVVVLAQSRLAKYSNTKVSIHHADMYDWIYRNTTRKITMIDLDLCTTLKKEDVKNIYMTLKILKFIKSKQICVRITAGIGRAITERENYNKMRHIVKSASRLYEVSIDKNTALTGYKDTYPMRVLQFFVYNQGDPNPEELEKFPSLEESRLLSGIYPKKQQPFSLPINLINDINQHCKEYNIKKTAFAEAAFREYLSK